MKMDPHSKKSQVPGPAEHLQIHHRQGCSTILVHPAHTGSPSSRSNRFLSHNVRQFYSRDTHICLGTNRKRHLQLKRGVTLDSVHRNPASYCGQRRTHRVHATNRLHLNHNASMTRTLGCNSVEFAARQLLETPEHILHVLSKPGATFEVLAKGGPRFRDSTAEALRSHELYLGNRK